MYSAWMEGNEKGERKGMREGLRKGRIEGKREGILDTARNLLIIGVPVSQIMAATGLTLEQINELKNQSN